MFESENSAHLDQNSLNYIQSISWVTSFQTENCDQNEFLDNEAADVEKINEVVALEKMEKITLQKNDFLFICNATEDENVYIIDCYGKEEYVDQNFYETADQIMASLEIFFRALPFSSPLRT